jgi:hypothetical protein
MTLVSALHSSFLPSGGGPSYCSTHAGGAATTATDLAEAQNRGHVWGNIENI